MLTTTTPPTVTATRAAPMVDARRVRIMALVDLDADLNVAGIDENLAFLVTNLLDEEPLDTALANAA